MTLIKSKERFADHGEVFTPSWMLEAMLDLLTGEAERIYSRFQECTAEKTALTYAIVIRQTHLLEKHSAHS